MNTMFKTSYIYIEREKWDKMSNHVSSGEEYVCVLFFVYAKILQAGYSTKWQPHLKKDEKGVQNLCLQGFS
jgi:hypothetical protein